MTVSSLSAKNIDFDSETYTQSIRIYGKNLKTDMSKVWFGRKPQLSFQASEDGSYIDIEAPLIPFGDNLDTYTIDVKLQINENEDLFTNSIEITYFRLEIEKITIKWSWSKPVSNSFSLEWNQGNNIVFENDGSLIRHRTPILFESTTGKIR